mmetsp:Transcript_60293/g.194153  ORF Transcript_60293/g.194153 Transcript_60293/m.194153 type:complete len:309 (+) Transcript_60293:322-1248(+)
MLTPAWLATASLKRYSLKSRASANSMYTRNPSVTSSWAAMLVELPLPPSLWADLCLAPAPVVVVIVVDAPQHAMAQRLRKDWQEPPVERSKARDCAVSQVYGMPSAVSPATFDGSKEPAVQRLQSGPACASRSAMQHVLPQRTLASLQAKMPPTEYHLCTVPHEKATPSLSPATVDASKRPLPQMLHRAGAGVGACVEAVTWMTCCARTITWPMTACEMNCTSSKSNPLPSCSAGASTSAISMSTSTRTSGADCSCTKKFALLCKSPCKRRLALTVATRALSSCRALANASMSAVEARMASTSSAVAA